MSDKKPWYKRKKVWKWLGISYLALMLVGIVGGFMLDVTGYSDKVEAEQKAQQEVAQAKKDAELQAKKDEEKAKADAKAAEEKAEQERLANRTIDEKIKDAVVTSMHDDSYRSHKFEDGTLWIEVNASGNLSQNMVLKGTYMDSLAIAKIVREESLLDGANDVDIAFYTELTDAYGNSSDGAIVEVGFTADTLNKINFDNVLHGNVPTIADYYWEHPLFSKK